MERCSTTWAALSNATGLSGSLPDVPDVPKWLLLLVGKGKLILIAAVVLLVAAGRWHAKRQGSPGR